MTDETRHARIRALAAKPYARDLFGIEVVAVIEGSVTLALPLRRELGHAEGWFQGTVTSALAELAAAWSGLTLLPDDRFAMTLEQSIRFVGPARGERLVAEGRVIEAGRTITFTAADVFVENEGARTLVATMQQTNRVMEQRA